MMTMMTMMLLRKGDDIASSHPEASVSFQIGMGMTRVEYLQISYVNGYLQGLGCAICPSNGSFEHYLQGVMVRLS